MNVQATDDDVADEAAEVAAKSGGTHHVLTDKGVETFTVDYPAEEQTHCRDQAQRVDCHTTYVAPVSNTYEKPTAKFVVLRVPVEAWGRLPEAARPVAGKP